MGRVDMALTCCEALALLSFEETPIAGPLRVFLVESIAYVIGWVAFPLAMVYVARALGREKRYVNYIVAFNWAQVPQVLLFLTGAVLANGLGMTGHATDTLMSILSLAGAVSPGRERPEPPARGRFRAV